MKAALEGRAPTGAQVLLAAALAAAALSPVLLPGRFGPGHALPEPLALAGRVVALVAPLAAVALAWRLPLALDRRDKALLFAAVTLLAWWTVDLHLTEVDRASYFPPSMYADNTAWQRWLHAAVLRLDPGVLPHSYRFLPDCIIALLESLTGSFDYARAIYRLTFQWALLFAVYYLARLYLGHARALAVLLLYCLTYPASIRFYAGQPADPASHLSFVLAFIFIELDAFAAFLAAVLIGILAKESIAALGFYPLLFERGRRARGAFAAAAAVGLVAAVRLLVHARGFGYSDVSGVDAGHALRNLAQADKWPRQVLFTVGLFAPFAALGWRRAPATVKREICLVAPALLGSNLLFGMLHESRNYEPLAALLAIVSVQAVAGDADAA